MGQKAILIDLLSGIVQEVTVNSRAGNLDVSIYLDIRHSFKNGDVLIQELRVPGVPSGKFVPYSCAIEGVQGVFRQSCLILNPSGIDVQTPLGEIVKRVRFRKNPQG